MFYRLSLWLRDNSVKLRGAAWRTFFQSKQLVIGKRFECQRGVELTIRGNGQLKIGDDVLIRRDVEIRVTGNASVTIGSNVRLDRGVRIIATNDSVVNIESGVRIGLHTVLNAGDSISIGEKTLISGYVYLQTSMHRHQTGKAIQDQGYDHAEVKLGSDAWLGTHVVVMPGCDIADHAVVGSNAVVTKSVNEGEIVAGVPAKPIKSR